jgi:O-antigen/teichoic acid export membrane protein
MLTKADFGLASLLTMTLALLDLTSRMSINQQVVQSKAGDTAVFRNTCHAMQALMGCAGALLMALLARPAAVLCDVPEVTWAFAALALAPLVHGFVHLDIYVRQRRLEYGPAIVCDLAPQVVMTAAAWPLALWLKDFRVMLWLELARVVVMVAMTHLTASTGYRWAWHRPHFRSMLAFGWPLILSGMLMALSQQADRIVVSRFYSLGQVAEYSVAFSLITVPFLIFAQVASSTMLPVLSRSQDAPARFTHHYRICLECAALISVGVMAPIMAMSDRIATLLYGAKYSGSGAILTVLGAAVAFRLLRVATFTAAMAMGDTRNQLTSNVARCSGLVLALSLALAGTNVLMVAAAAVAGEAAALLVSIARLRRKQAIHAGFGVKAVLFVAASTLAATCVRWMLPQTAGLFFAGMIAAVLLAALAGLGLLLFGETSRLAWANVLSVFHRRSQPVQVTS